LIKVSRLEGCLDRALQVEGVLGLQRLEGCEGFWVGRVIEFYMFKGCQGFTGWRGVRV
jgi:hypothetical protein